MKNSKFFLSESILAMQDKLLLKKVTKIATLKLK